MTCRVLTASLLALLAAVLIALLVAPALAADTAIEAWFKSLTQPNSMVSCCDTSDGRRTKARIGPNGWEAMTPDGDWIEIPEDRIVRPKSNPTGEAVLFLSPYGMVYCFVPPAET